MKFLCGLPRSGSTLLATVLNQHPEIYASPHSALLYGLSGLYKTFSHSEPVKYGLRLSAYQKTLWTLPQHLYQDIEKDVVFDKHFEWSALNNYELAQKISTYPQFIVCHRPILEVLASFVSRSVDNPEYYLNKEIKASNFPLENYSNENDALADYLMTDHPLISNALAAVENAKKQEESGRFKFVSYDDLTSEPEKVMLDIFDFLGLQPIEVQTENLQDIFRYKDSNALGVEGFHYVRPTIKKESPKPEDLFSDFILQKYANALAPIGL